MSEQKRKTVRIQSDQFISFKVYDDQNRICDEGMALAKDISKSGVLLENRTGFEIGAKVQLTIALSDELVNVKGSVRRVQSIDDNSFQIGIEFEGLSEEEIEKIASEFPNIL